MNDNGKEKRELNKEEQFFIRLKKTLKELYPDEELIEVDLKVKLHFAGVIKFKGFV